MEVASLQGLPLLDARHKGAAGAKECLFCLAHCFPTRTTSPSGSLGHRASSDICLFGYKHLLEAWTTAITFRLLSVL